MFQTNTLTDYVTDFDVRREALNQAMRHTAEGAPAAEVLFTAETFFKFLKGEAKQVRPDPRDPQS